MTASSTNPLHAALRGCARGIYPDEAGVELLIAHAAIPPRPGHAAPQATASATSIIVMHRCVVERERLRNGRNGQRGEGGRSQ
ncbi:MAG TPA: hypothetical protein VMV92_35285 [Streptosporangiaceae bacterium]|nr:hypothetical protein [Streptosporangiaceae bacterium]